MIQEIKPVAISDKISTLETTSTDNFNRAEKLIDESQKSEDASNEKKEEAAALERAAEALREKAEFLKKVAEQMEKKKIAFKEAAEEIRKIYQIREEHDVPPGVVPEDADVNLVAQIAKEYEKRANALEDRAFAKKEEAGKLREQAETLKKQAFMVVKKDLNLTNFDLRKATTQKDWLTVWQKLGLNLPDQLLQKSLAEQEAGSRERAARA